MMSPLLVIVGILLPVSTIGRVNHLQGNVYPFPGVAQMAPGVAQVAPVVAQVAAGVAQGASGVAQVSPGALVNPYANYYRMLMQYYQSLNANRNQFIGNPLLNNQNLAMGAITARQQAATIHNVDYNIFKKKKDDYDKYPPNKHDKYPDGHYKDKHPGDYPDGTYKDKHPGDYPDGTYKEHDKYPTDPYDTIYPPGYHHDKHPKDYPHGPHHDKYPEGKYHHKDDKYPTDLYPKDKHRDGKYMGIHTSPHHDIYPHDYNTGDKYSDGKYKETYPSGHMHDKYPNGKKDDHYHKDKYPNEKYMGIHSNYHHDVYPDNKYPDGHYTGYRHDKYPGGKYPDRHYKGSHHDKYPSDYLHDKKHIRPHSHHSRLGGTDSLVEFGLPVSDVGRGIRRGGLTGLFDDVVGVPGRRSRAGGLFSGSIPDQSVGIARGLLDVGPFSSSRRHGHIHLPHKGNDYDNKYPHGPQHKNHNEEQEDVLMEHDKTGEISLQPDYLQIL
uniref:Uncharacterized protein n=1 Tax=Magallana gigas TaxID=29159 RepID=A0A8W8NR57_MAGGI